MNKLSYVTMGGAKKPLCHCLKSEQALEELFGGREKMVQTFNDLEKANITELTVNLCKALTIMVNTAIDYIDIFKIAVDKDVDLTPLEQEDLMFLYSTMDVFELVEMFFNAIQIGENKETDVEESTDEKNKQSPQA